jgi:hypothetical protein
MWEVTGDIFIYLASDGHLAGIKEMINLTLFRAEDFCRLVKYTNWH